MKKKNILLINGSPNGKKGVSQHFLNALRKVMRNTGHSFSYIYLKGSFQHELQLQKDLDEMAKANVVVFSLPLYIYCLPAIGIRYLDTCYRHANVIRGNDPPLIYAIVNCGFPYPFHNREALGVLRHFSRRMGFRWRFGVGIGAGGVVRATSGTILDILLNTKITSAMKRIAYDLEMSAKEPQADIFVKPKIPDWMFLRLANANWRPKAKKSGRELEELYRRPFC